MSRRLSDAWEGAQFGALAGLALAGLALLIGAGRIAFALIVGTTVALPSRDDATMISAYVGAFVLGGAIVGAIHALWSSRILTTVGFMLVGALVMNAIAIASDGLAAYDRVDAIGMTILGAVFGLAGAYGVAKQS